MDSDADRLEMIQALGGRCLRAEGQEFWAIFKNPSSMIGGEIDVQTHLPHLICRTCDAERVGLKNGVAIERLPKLYVVERVDDEEDPGMNMVILGL